MKKAIVIVSMLAMVLVACTTAAQPATVTAQDVADKFVAVDVGVSDVKPGDVPDSAPLPRSYQEHIEFVVAEVAPRGGQIFVCDTKKNCDAIYSYFDALKVLAGPYTYQSPSGLVVAQLNSGLSPETAAKFEEVIKSIP